MSEFRTIPPKLTKDEWNALLDHGLEKPLSYIIRKVEEEVQAVNGKTGKIDFRETDAATVIQSAINALERGKIFIKAGIYILNPNPTANYPTIVLNKSNIALIGEGIGKTIFKPTKQELLLGNASIAQRYPLIGTPIKNVEIEAITFDSSGYLTGYGFVFREVTNIRVKDCEFINNGHLFIKPNHLWYINNYQHDQDRSAPQNGIMTHGGNSIHIAHNTFKTMDDDMIAISQIDAAEDGVMARYAEDVEIIGNVLISSRANGVAVYGSKNVSVTGNVCNANEASGIYVSTTSGSAALGIFDVVIAGNTVRNASNYGIIVMANPDISEISRRFIVVGNKVFNCMGGILIGNVYDTLVGENQVYNSTGTGVTQGNGILVYGERALGSPGATRHIKLSDNSLRNNARYATELAVIGAVNAIDDVFIGRNDLRGNAGGYNLYAPAGGTATNLIFKGNFGYVTENNGTATILAGATSVTVAHGLTATPKIVKHCPRANLGAVWVSARDATNITLNVATAPTVDTITDWEAEV